MSTVLLSVLIILLCLLVIPLVMLLVYLYPSLNEHDGDISILRKIIYILVIAKLAFIGIILFVDVLLLNQVEPLSNGILFCLILAVSILCGANWWSFYKVKKLHEKI